MNALSGFRLCALSDEALAKKVEDITDRIYLSGYAGEKVLPPTSIPAKPDEDYDLLIAELIIRFRESKGIES